MKPPAKSKMSARGPQTGQRGLDWVQLKVISPSKQLSLNKFFDLRTPSMRNMVLPAKSKIAPGGPQNGPQGLTLGYLSLQTTFVLRTPSMRNMEPPAKP